VPLSAGELGYRFALLVLVELGSDIRLLRLRGSRLFQMGSVGTEDERTFVWRDEQGHATTVLREPIPRPRAQAERRQAPPLLRHSKTNTSEFTA